MRTDVTADPQSAATIRREFSDWLGRYFMLDATKASDVVLAVNEAMANAAEYAYVNRPRPGAMHVCARYDGSAATLSVTVTDEGAWRSANPATAGNRRGRGIPLMHALTDRATVDSSSAGTTVCLEWNHVAASATTADASRTAAAAPPERRTRRSVAPRP
jgi:anti-sigma regulatory factor (Ser/Thr protein kinase)